MRKKYIFSSNQSDKYTAHVKPNYIDVCLSYKCTSVTIAYYIFYYNHIGQQNTIVLLNVGNDIKLQK